MTTPGIIEQLDRCLAFENELIATVGEAFYVWIADRARAAHPAPSVENEGGADLRAIIDAQAAQIAALDAFIAARAFPPVQGGADYEAKARQTTDWILGFMEDECSLLPECVDWADRRNIANAIVNALAQSAETEDKRNERLRAKRQLRYDKERRTITSPDPRDPDYTRVGMFVLHNCSRCKDGREPCIAGNPHQCEYPHARND
jgi:hypothetical protein